jgi:hypothetical protein
VCSIDRGEYSAEYPREAWAYLGRGVMVMADAAGLMHYTESDHDMELVARGSPDSVWPWSASPLCWCVASPSHAASGASA